MEKYMPLILDFIVVVMIISFMSSSARKGFVRTVIQFAGYLVSIMLASITSRIIAVFTYDTFIRNNIVNFLEKNLENATNQDMIITELARAIENLPPIVSGIFSSGHQNLETMLPDMLTMDMGDIAINLTDTVFAPMALMVLRSVFFFIVFGIALFFVKTFARAFTGLNRIPLIGPVNSLLGGVVGILEAVLFLYILAMLIDFVLVVSGNSIPLLTRQSINSTYLFKNFFDVNFSAGIWNSF